MGFVSIKNPYVSPFHGQTYEQPHNPHEMEAKESFYVQLRTMDHLARIAMKNAANCVKYGELQGFRNRYMSNAYCGPVIDLTGPRLSEGLFKFNEYFAVITPISYNRVLGITMSQYVCCSLLLCAIYLRE